MSDFLRAELDSLLSQRREGLDAALGIKGVNDRVDALTLLCREILRASSLCVLDGQCYSYDGRCYVPAPRNAIQSIVGNMLIDSGASPCDVRRMGSMAVDVLVEKGRVRDDAICFSNGVLNLKDGFFSGGFSPDLFVTEVLPYRYDMRAKCPTWDNFLAEVMPDATEREALLEFLSTAYIDRSRVSIEKMALFIGRGANGKSVICETMKAVLGGGAVSNLDPAQMRDEKMLPSVAGRRMNFAPDVRKNADFDSSLKALASGQEVTARRLYADAETFRCPPIVFALNDMPYFRDTSDAFFRRLLLFSFDVVIPPEKQDRTLADKIRKSDLPGIFAQLMAARERLLARGGEFVLSEKMQDTLRHLRASAVGGAEYPVRAYLEQRGLTPEPDSPDAPWVNITRNEIETALCGRVTRAAITRELAIYGVTLRRGSESYYRVYKQTK